MAAPAVAPGDVLEIRVFSQLFTQAGINVRHLRVVSTLGTSRTLADIADHMSNVSDIVYKPLLVSTATYKGVGLRRVTPSPTLEFFSIVDQGPGTAAGDALPGQTAGLLKLGTDFPGPSGRGRAYAPFPAESDNDANGQPTLGYITKMGLYQALWTTDTNVTDGGGNEALLRNVLVRRPAFTWRDITSSLIRDTWATQRRRRLGVGGDVLPL